VRPNKPENIWTLDESHICRADMGSRQPHHIWRYQMKTFLRMAAQGDVLISRIDHLPPNIIPAAAENGQYIIAHSETGHSHVIDSVDVEFFHAANDSFVSYLRVKQPTDLRHLRSFDTHAPIHIQPGDYRINRQREYTPEGFRRAAD